MLTNADMTVYHLVTDTDAREEKWMKTVIRGVCWQDKTAIQAESGGTKTADYANIYIPRASWCGGAAPCQPEDRVARGIRKGTAPPSDALAVTGVSNKDMGRTVRHWAVTAA